MYSNSRVLAQSVSEKTNKLFVYCLAEVRDSLKTLHFFSFLYNKIFSSLNISSTKTNTTLLRLIKILINNYKQAETSNHCQSSCDRKQIFVFNNKTYEHSTLFKIVITLHVYTQNIHVPCRSSLYWKSVFLKANSVQEYKFSLHNAEAYRNFCICIALLLCN